MALRNGKALGPPSGAKSGCGSGLGSMVACLVLYALVMAGVRFGFYAHQIGTVGKLLTTVGIYRAVRWYDRGQKKAEVLPEEAQRWPIALRARFARCAMPCLTLIGIASEDDPDAS